VVHITDKIQRKSEKVYVEFPFLSYYTVNGLQKDKQKATGAE
jgi:hypothetical protein